MNLPASFLVLLLGLAASAAYPADDTYKLPAPELYRSTMPNGDVLYGEVPAPGAKSVRKVQSPPGSTGTRLVTPQDQERARSMTSREGGVTVMPAPDESDLYPSDGRVAGRPVPASLPRRAY